MGDPFEQDQYLIRRKLLTLLGAKFHIYDNAGNVIGFSKQKAFKLKEDIRVYSDESMSKERLVIRARQIIDFSAAYDVVDSESKSKIGGYRRKGWSSMVRDAWEMLDNSDRVIATVQEDSMGMALIRRFLLNIIPQSFHVEAGGRQIATFRQHFNPFIFKMSVQLAPDARKQFDARLILAGGILLAAIEGRQE